MYAFPQIVLPEKAIAHAKVILNFLINKLNEIQEYLFDFNRA